VEGLLAEEEEEGSEGLDEVLREPVHAQSLALVLSVKLGIVAHALVEGSDFIGAVDVEVELLGQVVLDPFHALVQNVAVELEEVHFHRHDLGSLHLSLLVLALGVEVKGHASEPRIVAVNGRDAGTREYFEIEVGMALANWALDGYSVDVRAQVDHYLILPLHGPVQISLGEVLVPELLNGSGSLIVEVEVVAWEDVHQWNKLSILLVVHRHLLQPFELSVGLLSFPDSHLVVTVQVDGVERHHGEVTVNVVLVVSSLEVGGFDSLDLLLAQILRVLWHFFEKDLVEGPKELFGLDFRGV